MHEKRLHRLIVIISGILLVLSSLSFIYFFYNTANEWLIIFSAAIALYSLITLTSSFALKFKDRRWVRFASKYSWILMLIMVLIIIWRTANSTYVPVIELTLLLVFVYMFLIHIYLFTKATNLTGTIIFVLIMLLGMFLKRNHWPGAGVALQIGCTFLGVGSVMFSVRCLFLSENHAYFRNITFYGGFILSLSFFGSLAKLQHWPGAGPLLMSSLVLLIFGTVFLLFTLHSSGIIEWNSAFRKIFIKILIPWTIIFFIYFSRFLIPDLYNKIWSPEIKKSNTITEEKKGFGMKDYEVEQKNGLKSEK